MCVSHSTRGAPCFEGTLSGIKINERPTETMSPSASSSSTAATIGSSSIISTSTTSSKSHAASPPLQAVVLGFGMAGKGMHSYLLAHSQQFRLRGVMIHSYDKRRHHYNEKIDAFCELIAPAIKMKRDQIKIYTSYEELLEDKDSVDLVVVATPNDSHLSYAKKASKDGFNVVVDKPVCNNLSEWNQLKQHAQQLGNKGPVISVFHNRRLDGDFLTVKDLIRTGQLGQVHHMEFSWQKFGSTSKEWKRVSVEQGGGRFFDLGIHMLDQVLELLVRGDSLHYKVSSVYCDMKFDEHDMEVSTICHIKFVKDEKKANLRKSPKEVSVILDTSTLTTVEKPRFLVVGTKGTFAKYGVDPQEQSMFEGDIHSAKDPEHLHGILRRVSDPTEEVRIPTLPGEWLNYYDNIGEAIRFPQSVRPNVEFESMDLLMRIMDAAVRSGRSGEVIRSV